MPTTLEEARAHYLELLKEGEALGHRFGALGRYISQRLTPAELRELLRDHYHHLDKRQSMEANE